MKAESNIGFTVVELMVAMVSAAIIGLTIAVVVYAAYSGLAKTRAMAELERDGSLAMRKLSREIRKAARTNLTVEVARFVSTGGQLRYPDANGMILIQQGVQSFAASIGTNQVTVVLSLMEPKSGMTMVMTNNITARN
jgi:type II secretory pathway component PulJ